MFDLDPGKLLVIGIVALVAIPSKDLPRVLRALGQATGRMRRMAAEFQGQFMAAMREAELDALRKEIDATKTVLREEVNLSGSFDAMIEARKQMTEAISAQTRLSPPQPAQTAPNEGAPDTERNSAGDANS